MEDIDRLELVSDSEDEEITTKKDKNEVLSQNFMLKTHKILDETLTSGAYEGKTVKRDSLKKGVKKSQKLSNQEQEKAFEKLKNQKSAEVEEEISEDESISDILSDEEEPKGDINIFKPSNKDKQKDPQKQAQSDKDASLAEGLANQKNMFNEILKLRILVNKLSQKIKFMPQKEDFSKYYESSSVTKQKLEQQNANSVKLLQMFMILKNQLMKKSLSTYDPEELQTKEAELRKITSATLKLQEAQSTTQIWDLLQYQQNFFNDFMGKCYEDFDKKKKPNTKVGFNERVSKKLEKLKEKYIKESQNSTAGDKLKVFGHPADDEFDDEKEEINDPETYDDKLFYKSLLATLTKDEDDDVTENVGSDQKKDKAHMRGLKTGKVLSFEPHEKLQNFMSPEQRLVQQTAANEVLFKSLFGGKSVENFLKQQQQQQQSSPNENSM